MSIEGLDTQVLLLINNGLAGSSLDVVMIALSDRGYLLFLPYLLYMVVRGWSGRAKADVSVLKLAVLALLVAIVSSYTADAFADLLKPLFARLRPCHAVSGIRLVVRCSNSFSMPSGHAISSFAAATTLFYLPRHFIPVIARWYPLLLAAAVALSRVYLGVHYPSDVIVGAALGSVVAMLFCLLSERSLPKRPRQSSYPGNPS